MEKYVKTLVAVLIAVLGLGLAACSSDDDGDYDDATIKRTEIVGTWVSDDTYFITDCLYFSLDGQGLYEYGNNLSSGNRKIKFRWYYNAEKEYVRVEMDEYCTDLDGGRVFRLSDGTLVLDYLGGRYLKESDYVPSFTDGNESGGNSGSGSGNGNQPSVSHNKDILLKHCMWSWYKSSFDNGFFTFYDGNKISFVCSGKSKVGSYGVPNLRADGTFTISGNTIRANYSDVSVDTSGIDMSTHFPGWSVGKSRTISYTIRSISDTSLSLTDGTNTWYLEP